MNAQVRKNARLVRVRSIQHDLAAMVAEQAQRQLATLEASADKLARLRDGFGAGQGTMSADTLASMSELAMRLDLARLGLEQPIAGARAKAETCREVRIDAWRNQTSAERLMEKTVKDAERLAEKRRPMRAAPRRPYDEQE
jgi:flagellar biosynthesis chaperone FliJ